jgi:hypothetical protein
MKCADVLEILHGDNGDLEAVARHIKNCPVCAERYGRDFELEMALKKLGNEVEAVDIISQVSDALYLRQKRQVRFNLARRWVWIFTGMAIVMFLVVTVPFWTDLFKEIYGYFYSAVDALDKYAETFTGNLISSEDFSRNFTNFLYLLAVVLAGIFIYLWREFKGIIQ